VKKCGVAFLTRQYLLISGLKHVLASENTPCKFCELPPSTEMELWLAAAQKLRPEIVLIDGLSRIPYKIIEEVHHRLPEAHVLLWVTEPDLTLARQALDLGVRGLVKADTSPQMLIRCLERVSEGEMWFDRNVTEGLMNSASVQLSRREYQLLVLVCNGLSNKEIAEALVLAEGTVKFYLSRLFKKCTVSDRLELALFGLRHFFQHTPEAGDPLDMSVPPGSRRVLVDQLPQRRFQLR